MRKITKLLLTIFLFTLSISIVKANLIIEQNRTEDNNYGVNKKWEITSKNKTNVLNTPYVDSNLKVYDYQDSLTDEEIEKLQEQIKEYTDATGFDMAIVVTSFPFSCRGDDCGTTNDDWANDFYDYNDFGLELDDEYYSGVIIVRNEYIVDGLGYMTVRYFGEAQLYYNERAHDSIYAAGKNYMTSKEYYTGFTKMIDKLNYYYKKGKDKNLALDKMGHVYDTRYYKLNSNGKIVKKWRPPYFIAFIIALVTELIVVGIMKKKNKMVYKAMTATSFLDTSSINYTQRDNILTNTFVTHRHIDRSSSSGGGGGGFHGGGSSGGGSSGGGGRC